MGALRRKPPGGGGRPRRPSPPDSLVIPIPKDRLDSVLFRDVPDGFLPDDFDSVDRVLEMGIFGST